MFAIFINENCSILLIQYIRNTFNAQETLLLNTHLKTVQLHVKAVYER